MGGGGKGSGQQQYVAPRYVDPISGREFMDDPDPTYGGQFTPDNPAPPRKSGAEKLNEFIGQRDTEQKNKSIADAALAEQQKVDKRNQFNTGLETAKTGATTRIQDYFKERGIDYNPYSDRIASKVNQEASLVPDLSPTPGGAFQQSDASDLFNEIQGGVQTQNLTGYNKVFDPNYSNRVISDSWVDPAVNDAVSSLFSPLQGQLDNARKRGQLSDTGYQGAQKEYETRQTGARASVGKIASGILGSDRGQLDEYIGGGRTAAGSAPLGTAFSVDPYQQGANERVNRFQSSFGGDVLSGVGDTQYASLSDLLNAGGAYQGAFDPAATPGAVGGAPGIGSDPDAIAKAALKRGLDTQGAF